MTEPGHSAVSGLFAVPVLTLIVAAGSATPAPAPAAEQIAKAYGLDSFGQVEKIRYTWNAEFPGVKVSRTWEWEPRTDQVHFEGQDESGKPVSVAYQRSRLASEPDNVRNEIDPSFMNDQYWVLFPLHAAWDSGTRVTDQGMQKLPLAGGSARRILVKYPADAGGYTPGDTWELYVGADHRIEEFVYHRGGPKKPSVVTATWAGYKKAGPLLVSTDHRGTADGKPLRVFLTNVAVKVAGSDGWVNAQ